jgi:hypothetical protein
MWRVSDWSQFVDCAPWFVRPGEEEAIAVGDPQPWTRGAVEGLPQLSALLASATVTPVSVAGQPYELFAWGTPDDRRGWLCHPPPHPAPAEVPETLRLFWTACGGIVEQFGGPPTWWNNQNEVLTTSATDSPVSAVLPHCEWVPAKELEDLVDATRPFVTVGIEANGNLTAAHRSTGHLVLLAPDHAFDGITPLPGSPEYLLYSFDALPDLTAWIESCARAWRRPDLRS